MKQQFLQILFLIIITNTHDSLCVVKSRKEPIRPLVESHDPKKIASVFEKITAKNKPTDWDIIEKSNDPDSDWDIIDSAGIITAQEKKERDITTKKEAQEHSSITHQFEELLQEQKALKDKQALEKLIAQENKNRDASQTEAFNERKVLLENLEKAIQNKQAQEQLQDKALQEKATKAQESESQLNQLRQTALQNQEAKLRRQIESESGKRSNFSDFVKQRQQERTPLVDQEKQGRAALESERTKLIQDMMKNQITEQKQIKINRTKQFQEAVAKQKENLKRYQQKLVQDEETQRNPFRYLSPEHTITA